MTPKPLSDFKHVTRLVLTSGGYFGIAIMNLKKDGQFSNDHPFVYRLQMIISL